MTDDQQEEFAELCKHMPPFVAVRQLIFDTRNALKQAMALETIASAPYENVPAVTQLTAELTLLLAAFHLKEGGIT